MFFIKTVSSARNHCLLLFSGTYKQIGDDQRFNQKKIVSILALSFCLVLRKIHVSKQAGLSKCFKDH